MQPPTTQSKIPKQLVEEINTTLVVLGVRFGEYAAKAILNIEANDVNKDRFADARIVQGFVGALALISEEKQTPLIRAGLENGAEALRLIIDSDAPLREGKYEKRIRATEETRRKRKTQFSKLDVPDPGELFSFLAGEASELFYLLGGLMDDKYGKNAIRLIEADAVHKIVEQNIRENVAPKLDELQRMLGIQDRTPAADAARQGGR